MAIVMQVKIDVVSPLALPVHGIDTCMLSFNNPCLLL